MIYRLVFIIDMLCVLCDVEAEILCVLVNYISIVKTAAVRFETGRVHMGSTVDKMRPKLGFVGVLRFSALRVLSPMLHAHLYLLFIIKAGFNTRSNV